MTLALTSSKRALTLAFCWIIKPASINSRVASPTPVPTILLMIAFVSLAAPGAGASDTLVSLTSIA
ncbi:MAG: hypothetical protein F4137_06070 [Acidobacteria bacterium]|nr:hypothetical protein [Acidobacteriota bacterium]